MNIIQHKNCFKNSYCIHIDASVLNYLRLFFKVIIFLPLLTVFLGDLHAQDTANTYSAEVRPVETDILLNTPDSDNSVNDNTGLEDGQATTLTGIGFGDFLRMIFVLIIVIGLVYGFFWLLKRYSGIKPEGIEAIRVLSTRPLKGDTALHIIETGTRIFLVGSTSNTINLIKEIDDKESIDEIRLSVSRNTPDSSGRFSRFINNRFNLNTTEKRAINLTDSTSFLKKQRGRLSDL